MLTRKRIYCATSLAEIFSENSSEDRFTIPIFQDHNEYLNEILQAENLPNRRPSNRGIIGSIFLQSAGQIIDPIYRSIVKDAVLLLNNTESGAQQIYDIDHRNIPIIYSSDLPEIVGGHLSISSHNSGENEYRENVSVLLNGTWTLRRLAGVVSEELRHLAQWENMKLRPSGEHLHAGSVRHDGWANQPVINLVMEADAAVRTLITAFEFDETGISEPLKRFESDPLNGAHLVDALYGMLDDGVALHSPEIKRALFDRWMTDQDGPRSLYESKMVRNRANYPSPDWTPGISLSSQDLLCITQDRDGTSYLEGVDLLAPHYTQNLARLSKDTVTSIIANLPYKPARKIPFLGLA